MINRLIQFSARNAFLVVLLILAIAGSGYWALRKTPIDAIPDLSDVQVIIMTDWEGRSPTLVEDHPEFYRRLSREAGGGSSLPPV